MPVAAQTVARARQSDRARARDRLRQYLKGCIPAHQGGLAARRAVEPKDVGR